MPGSDFQSDTSLTSEATGRQHAGERIEPADAVQEIVSGKPGYLVRRGTLIIFAVLLLVITGMGFIHYPEILEGTAVITTNPLPIRLKAAAGGRIINLFAGDGRQLAKDAPIAELQNNTGYSTVLAISGITDSVAACLEANNMEALNGVLAHPLQATGEAQPYYNSLLQSISAYLLLKSGRIYAKRIGSIARQVERYNSVAAITGQETALGKEDLKQSAERFVANEKLYRDKVISRQEYYDESARLRQKQLFLQSQSKVAIQNGITAGENSKQLAEVEYDKAEKERSAQLAIEEAVRNLQNYMQGWKLQYLLVAPFAGTLHYLRPLQINEPATAGDELFAVIPAAHHYVAQVLLPSSGFGKVQTGQKVHLLLSQFPHNEFGYLEGSVSGISALPQKGEISSGTAAETWYRVDVALPDSLVTTFHKPVAFSPEMPARARVITKDRRLLQRLLSGVAGMR